jgi:type I restriction enzyme S subunit
LLWLKREHVALDKHFMSNFHWVEAPLEDIVESIIDFRGRTPKKLSMEWGGDIPALSANNVQMGKINLEKGTQYGSEELYRRWMSSGDCAKGDIVLTMEAPLGNVAQIPDNQKYILSQRVILLKTKRQLIDNDFLLQRLLWGSFQAAIEEYATGTTAQGIQRAKLEKIPITFPPLNEQTRIAAILSCIDRTIEQTEKLIAKQQRIKRGLIQDLLTKGIDEHGTIRSEATHEFKDSPLGRIPKEWKVYELKKLTTVIVDGVHHTPKYVDSGIPFITISDITRGDEFDFSQTRYITEKDHLIFKRRVLPREGDVLVTKDGTLGKATIVLSHYPEFSIFVSVALLRPNQSLCIPELIWNFFNSNLFEQQLGELSAGTGLKHIHLEHFNKFLIATPQIEEQERIFRNTEGVTISLKREKKFLEKMKAVKLGLMQDLLTGTVRVSSDQTN